MQQKHISTAETIARSNKKIESTLHPTTHYFNTQLTIASFSNNPYSNQVREIKGNIDNIINQVKQKSSINHSAVQTVKDTNSEILRSIQTGNYQPSNYNSHKKIPQAKMMNYMQSPKFNSQCSGYFNTNSFDTNRNIRRYEDMSRDELFSQNQELKRRLNEEIFKNNSLLKRNQFLQNQNQSLKSAFQTHDAYGRDSRGTGNGTYTPFRGNSLFTPEMSSFKEVTANTNSRKY